MFNRIGKSLFTKFLIWSSRFEKPAEVIHYREIVGRAKRILIYIPDSAHEERIRYIQDRLKECFPEAQQEYVMLDALASDHKNFLMSTVEQDRITWVKKVDIGFWGLIRKNILEQFKDKQFDLVLDFGSAFDITLAHAFRASGAPVVAGLFLGRESELFHNLLIKTSGQELFDSALFDCLAQLR